MTIFEQASRAKLRFESPKGMLTVEDLWDLPLTSQTGKANLDDIAKTLHRSLKTEEVSFVEETTKTDAITALKFNVVKSVIDTLVVERKSQSEAKERRDKKAQILSLIAQKENEKLAGSSLDELRALADSL